MRTKDSNTVRLIFPFLKRPGIIQSASLVMPAWFEPGEDCEPRLLAINRSRRVCDASVHSKKLSAPVRSSSAPLATVIQMRRLAWCTTLSILRETYFCRRFSLPRNRDESLQCLREALADVLGTTSTLFMLTISTVLFSLYLCSSDCAYDLTSGVGRRVLAQKSQ